MKSNYDVKFADFLRLCADAKKGKLDVVVVHSPDVLGDDYGELVESLNRLADANLSLRIVPRAERGK
jgi:DNA invertase Pin-like site-specific DNA recombinase